MSNAAVFRTWPFALLLASSPAARAQQVPAPHPFFEPQAVQVVHLTFAQPNWYDILRQNFEHQVDPAYAPADFDWNGVHLDSVGVRFKGNSSYSSYPGTKKPFKLDLDEFVPGQELFGLDKLNLSNELNDPSFVRERMFFELAAELGLAAPRTNYTALYINNEYWGLYVGVEQVDQEFLESRFGSAEHGNLWKGDPLGTLAYHGPAPDSYRSDYELKTNETADDWSELIGLCDRLAHLNDAALLQELPAVLDLDSALAYLAVCNWAVALDSYLGRPHNLYYYDRTLDGRFALIPWDANEAFGARPLGLTVSQLARLDPSWMLPGPGLHPLAERLYAVPELRSLHQGYIRRLMAGGGQPDRLVARMESLRDVARPYALADSRKMYTNDQFEAAMQQDIDAAIVGVSPGLEPFVRGRNTYLETRFGPTSALPTLRINEIVTNNAGSVLDEAGQADPWIEIVNSGPASVDLAGVELRSQLVGANRFVFPSTILPAGSRVLVWCDGNVAQGPLHAPFVLSVGAEIVHLVSDERILDVVRPPSLAPGESWSRIPDTTGNFVLVPRATPQTINVLVAPPSLYVNEFLASNALGAVDEAGDHEDWVELWNPNAFSIDLTGWHLTDNLSNATKWTFPSATITGHGYLLVWCDDEPTEGPLHATFKLSASGEAVGLSAPSALGNAWVDRHTFSAQAADVSEGRTNDGALAWGTFAPPTPLSSNAGAAVNPAAIPYGIGKLTSTQHLPALGWTGTPSFTSNDFVVHVLEAKANSVGLLFYGSARAEVPFAGGTRWVSAPITRLGIHALDALGRTEYPLAIGAAVVGTTRCYQFWFRDVLHPDGTRTGLSAALEVQFGN